MTGGARAGGGKTPPAESPARFSPKRPSAGPAGKARVASGGGAPARPVASARSSIASPTPARPPGGLPSTAALHGARANVSARRAPAPVAAPASSVASTSPKPARPSTRTAPAQAAAPGRVSARSVRTTRSAPPFVATPTAIDANEGAQTAPLSTTESDLDAGFFTDAFGDAPSFLAGAPQEPPRAPPPSTPPLPAYEVAVEGLSIPPPPPRAAPMAPRPPVAEETPLYAVEETIDRLLADSRSLGEDPAARRRVAHAFAEIAGKLGGDIPKSATPGLLGHARDLLRGDYYERQWGPRSMRDRGGDVDPFGLDRSYEARMRPLFEGLYRRWFRVVTRDVSNVPADGRAMIVANRAGALPWDGLMLKTAMALEHPAHRELRWLVEDYVFHAPFLGAFTNRLGAVRACPENAERLLASESLLAVFPEGDKGVAKPFAQRYELQRFGRGGYVRLALRTRTPIIPTAIVGAEETHPMLFPTSRLAKLVGVPFLPVTATFPWLGPLGLVPLPSRWVIWVGEPIDLSREPPGAEDDPLAVQRISDEVRNAVSTLLRRALALRPAPF